MKITKPSPNLARNDFDLSHRYVHSINFGELIPNLCLETVPDDYFEIRASNLIRAIPFVSSPFLRAKQHIDLWFVPYSDLWHNFNQFIVGRKDPIGAAFKDYQYCPHANAKDIVNAIYSGLSGAKDIIGRNIEIGAEKIFNALGYGDMERIFADLYANPTHTYADVNLWRILAYNKIWYDEYRNKYYDDGTHLCAGSWLANPSGLWNVDDLSCNSYANAGITGSDVNNRLGPMFQMRYRQWKKDLFTGILPSTQFGSVSSVEVLTDKATNFKSTSQSNNILQIVPSSNSLVQNDASASSTNYTTILKGSLDVLALRKSEAIQKWRQIALMSPLSAWDNMRGHYGVTPDHDRDHRPTYIGSVDAPLNIGDINAQSQTGTSGNQLLASVAGKGLSSVSDHVFKFKANDFGIIMAMSSILPEAEYNSVGLDRPNQLIESDDYFKPEFQNLGLEGVGSYDFYFEDTLGLSVLGYAPRYYGYKQKIDKVSNTFRYFGSASTQGQFANWVSPKYDILSTLGSVKPLAGLYINPALYDNNFAVALSSSEQFMDDQYWDIKAVRPMSELGLPQF